MALEVSLRCSFLGSLYSRRLIFGLCIDIDMNDRSILSAEVNVDVCHRFTCSAAASGVSRSTNTVKRVELALKGR